MLVFIWPAYLSYGQIIMHECPKDAQLIPRELGSNSGTFNIAGTARRRVQQYDSIILELYRFNDLFQRKSIALVYKDNNASFSTTMSINAELANYTLIIRAKSGSRLSVVERVDDIVCGDAFIIQGQSNAEARRRSESAEDFLDPFIRVFASGEPDPEKLANHNEWYIANGDGGRETPGNAGQWGLRLAKFLVDSMNIPIAILNGGHGGRKLDFFLADENYQTSLQSNYGRMYYRLQESKLKNYIRAVIWSQGEANAIHGTSIESYRQDFIELRESWHADLPALEKIYIFQTKFGCGADLENSLKIKEAQRQMALIYDDVTIIPTNAIPTLDDFCHFPFTNGYEVFAKRIFSLIQYELYLDREEPIQTLTIRDIVYDKDNLQLRINTNAAKLSINEGTFDEFILNTRQPLQIQHVSALDSTLVLTINDPLQECMTFSYMGEFSSGGNLVSNEYGIELISFHEEPLIHTATDTLCYGEIKLFGENVIDEGGVYKNTFRNSNGCDSTVQLHAVYREQNITYLFDTIHTWEQYEFDHRLLNTTGEYFKNETAANGCDSTISLSLFVIPLIEAKSKIHICNEDSVPFGTQLVNKEGTYEELFVSDAGYDSLVTLTVYEDTAYQLSLNLDICNGDSAKFSDSTISEAGIYNYTYQSAYQCDSIIELSLNVNATYDIQKYRALCNGDSLHFGNRYIHESGTYQENFTSIQGCDSLVELTVSIEQRLISEAFLSICDKDTLELGSQKLFTNGLYDIIYTGSNGCDSTVRVDLTVHPRFEIDSTVILCPGEQFTYNDMTYDSSGIYEFIYESISGCDSLVAIHIQQAPEEYTIAEMVICEGDSVRLDQTWETTPGTFELNLLSSFGCDSTVQIILDVAPKYNLQVSEEICSGYGFRFNDETLRSPGRYEGVFTTTKGCDSLVSLHLNVLPTHRQVNRATICEGDSMEFFGNYISAPNLYRKIYDNRFGCDSIIFLDLEVTPESYEIQSSICIGDSLLFNGEYLQYPGIYPRHYTGASGCDSTVYLDLIVNPAFFVDQFVEICEGERYTLGNQDISESGKYSYTYQSSENCDSIVNLQVEVNATFQEEFFLDICAEESFMFGDSELTESGEYWNLFESVSGCDSTVILNLEKRPTYTDTTFRTICPRQSIQWGELEVSDPGTYQMTTTDSEGCNQLQVLVLVQHIIPESFTFVEQCEGTSFLFGNQLITKSGEYTQRLTSFNNCDSIAHLEIVFNDNHVTALSEVICETDVYHFFEQTLNETGTYQASITGINGCYSTVILDLAVKPNFEVWVEASICQGDSLIFDEKLLTEPGEYRFSKISQDGCDSLVLLQVSEEQDFFTRIDTSLCMGDGLTLNGDIFYETGTYEQVFQAVNGCDSLVRINLQIDSITLDVEQRGNQIKATAGYDNYKWFKCTDVTVVIDSDSHIFTPTENGEYRVTVNNGNCSYSSECLSFDNVLTGFDFNAVEITIYPNPTRESFQINLNPVPPGLFYTIYSTTGKVMETGKITGINTPALLEDKPSGTYILKLTRSDLSDFVRQFKLVKL
jgi:hypothetical protein